MESHLLAVRQALVALVFSAMVTSSSRLTAQAVETTVAEHWPNRVTIEELTYRVRPELREKFLRHDNAIWTTTLAAQPGFLGKDSWIDDQDPAVVKLVIRWRSAADSRAVPERLLTEAAQNFTRAMGGKETFRLASTKTYVQTQRIENTAASPNPGAGPLELDLGTLNADPWATRLRSVDVTNDPTFGKNKRYLAVNLADFLRSEFEQAAIDDEQATLVFICSDGYQPTMKLSRALEGGGWLAVRDLDAPDDQDWPSEARGKPITLAPYYLVWPHASQDDGHLVWPYALVKLRLDPIDRFHKAAFPLNSAEHGEGYQAFKAHCAKCHRINGAGGIMGPELNYPKNITEYWQRTDIEAFVRNPQSYRRASNMPSMQYLDKQTLTAVVDYLEHMASEKRYEP